MVGHEKRIKERRVRGGEKNATINEIIAKKVIKRNLQAEKGGMWKRKEKRKRSAKKGNGRKRRDDQNGQK